MKKTLIMAILLIALFASSFAATAQINIYQAKFYANGLTYSVLMVFNSGISSYDEKNYTRTAYYDRNHNYIVVNQNAHVESGTYQENRHYTTVSGYNPYFVNDSHGNSYNPDTYTFIYDDERNLTEPPFQGDVRHMSKPVSEFRRISIQELNYDLLRHYFHDGEPQLQYLLGLNSVQTTAADTQPVASPVDMQQQPVQQYTQQADIQPQYTQPQQQVSQSNQLVLINNTGQRIQVSFVYYDKGCSCWISRGWRKIPDGESNPINIDGLNIGSSTMYVHAENLLKSWGGNFTFCMNQTGQPLNYADQSNCETKKSFKQVNLHDGQNTFTFNP